MSESKAAKARPLAIKAGTIASLSAAILLGAASLASADGSSAKLNNCWSTWGSTGSSAHCVNTSQTGSYQNEAYCGGVDTNKASGWRQITKGSTIDPWGKLECTFSIRYSDIWFKG
ncbi:hypothetical protein OIE62_22695 [Streptomyces scopuliridis]|uniref:Uncharacterized protein n=1 Tax=Streptomyces scopuliridis TaxID=452529 RepID=A0ACD4ZK72_9ACTN|nr:hypothetical protein [Streptomyces scopuliridis]WSB34528.1 hypothetical protein OG949_17705 [Streptomyces scopuliridis]WSB98774.1 hypothetical protein OG835_18250 [Streptomyces scopuliridis]WSC07523.1 hypothetical protein OIE62_22695 [Streptomyces scopuliridis]